jgi:1-acyl-sn-glycerol-3-phosphate acyltransferase
MNRRSYSPSDPPGSENSATGPGHHAPGPASAAPGIFWSIFGRIWAIWVILLFIVTMLIILVPFLLFSYYRPDPQKTSNFARIARIWMGIFLPLAGCPLRVRGREKFAPGQTYIVACNHNALIDVPVSYPAIPGGNKTLAKIEMAKIPLFGMFYRTGSVLVDRKSETSRRESINKMREALDMGLHMCLYPEGTRNTTTAPLKSFHDGAFRLAIITGHAIIPAVIFNSRRIMPPKTIFLLRPCPLHMHFLDPVTPGPGESIESLKQRVFDIIWNYYKAGPHANR